jgi:hypothetical protein
MSVITFIDLLVNVPEPNILFAVAAIVIDVEYVLFAKVGRINELLKLKLPVVNLSTFISSLDCTAAKLVSDLVPVLLPFV